MVMYLDAVGTSTEPVTARWGADDCMLYALAVGAGADDPADELAYTTENTGGVEQRALPTMPIVRTLGAFREAVDRSGAFDPAMKVHGAQAVELHRPVPLACEVRASATIDAIVDKGKGAVVETSTTVVDAANGSPLATLRSSAFVRGEGGWDRARPSGTRPALPDRGPDTVVAQRTLPNQALLYRLTGDRNPLHSDPSFAARGGFDRPILHGLCTYGFAARALLRACCDGDPDRFVSMEARFSSPVVPGDELRTEIWFIGDGEVAFRVSTDRRAVALDAGRHRFAC